VGIAIAADVNIEVLEKVKSLRRRELGKTLFDTIQM
jgi:hypothetical protein